MNRFELKVNIGIIRNLFSKFDGMDSEWNVALLSLIRCNDVSEGDVFDLLICRFIGKWRKYGKREEQKTINSWFYTLHQSTLCVGPEGGYCIDYIYMAFQEVLKRHKLSDSS